MEPRPSTCTCVYALSRGEGESDRNELCGPLAGKGKGCTQKGHLSRAHSEVGRRGGGKDRVMVYLYIKSEGVLIHVHVYVRV